MNTDNPNTEGFNNIESYKYNKNLKAKFSRLKIDLNAEHTLIKTIYGILPSIIEEKK